MKISIIWEYFPRICLSEQKICRFYCINLSQFSQSIIVGIVFSRIKCPDLVEISVSCEGMFFFSFINGMGWNIRCGWWRCSYNVLMYMPTIPLIYESRSYGFSVCLGKKLFFVGFLWVWLWNMNVGAVLFHVFFLWITLCKFTVWFVFNDQKRVHFFAALMTHCNLFSLKNKTVFSQSPPLFSQIMINKSIQLK